MPITDTQRRVAQAIVNIFETSSVRGDYSKVTLLEGDSGRLTYGRSQTTLASGGLFKLISLYTRTAGAFFADALSPFLPDLEDEAEALDRHLHFHNLLRAAADDPVMRDTQDAFFDEEYWDSATFIARRDSIETPLGVAVVYDSRVHGSWATLRRRVNDNSGTVEQIGEQAWIAAYVEARHHWLANHRKEILRRTVYRMETFRALIEHDEWALEIPLVLRGFEINLETLNALPRGVYDGPLPRSREITVTSPLLRGLDVRLVQLALSADGLPIRADGIYGRNSKGFVEAYQRNHGLPVTGIVSLQDFEALDL